MEEPNMQTYLAAKASSLRHACELGDIDQVKTILNEPNTVDIITEREGHGQTALLWIIHPRSRQKETVRREIVELLIAKIANQERSIIFDCDDFGRTPLHWASRWGLTDIVRILLKAAGDKASDYIKAIDGCENTALYLAMKWNNTETEKYLVAVRDNPLLVCADDELYESIIKSDSSDLMYFENEDIFVYSFFLEYIPIAQYFYENGLPKRIIDYVFALFHATLHQFNMRREFISKACYYNGNYCRELVSLLIEYKPTCSFDLLVILLLKTKYELQLLALWMSENGNFDCLLTCLRASEISKCESNHDILCGRLLPGAIKYGHKEAIIAILKSAKPFANVNFTDSYSSISFERDKCHPDIIKILEFAKKSRKPELLDEYLATLAAEPIVVPVAVPGVLSLAIPAEHSNISTKRKKRCIVQ